MHNNAKRWALHNFKPEDMRFLMRMILTSGSAFMARSIDTISDIESKTTTCLTTSHTNEILLLYDRTIFSMARSTLQKNDFKNQLEEAWMMECLRWVCWWESEWEMGIQRHRVCVVVCVVWLCVCVRLCASVCGLSLYVCVCMCAFVYLYLSVCVIVHCVCECTWA